MGNGAERQPWDHGYGLGLCTVFSTVIRGNTIYLAVTVHLRRERQHYLPLAVVISARSDDLIKRRLDLSNGQQLERR
jgi:hypothetical protein